jgi:hypothetical protein
MDVYHYCCDYLHLTNYQLKGFMSTFLNFPIILSSSPGSSVLSCSSLTASSVAFCDFDLLLILASRSIFSTTSSLLMFSCVVVNHLFSSEEKMFVILKGSFDNNSDALFGSAFRKIIFDTCLMIVLA